MKHIDSEACCDVVVESDHVLESVFFALGLGELDKVNTEACDECRVWRYLVTLADDGCELKLWDCTSWSCLQTITLAPCRSVPVHCQVLPCIKAQLDPTASYLVLSDIRRKVCFIKTAQHQRII